MSWIPFALAGAGSLWNMYQQHRQTSQANRRANQLWDAAMPFVNEGPSALESYLGTYLRANPLGSDSLLQAMRADPTASSANAVLQGLLETGNPFDTSRMWEAYQPVRQRNLTENISQMRAGASGLGQRFGQSTLNAEGELRRRALEDWNAADTTMSMQAYEAAQGRRMSAADQLLQNIQQAMQFGSTNNLAIMQLLANLYSSRMGRQLGALGVAGGVPTAQYPQYGSGAMDWAQLLLMQQLFGNGNRNRTVPSPAASIQY